MTLTDRILQLKAAQEKIPEKLAAVAEAATLRAVETATELTPPTEDDLSGTNTRSGEMKQHWATDSRTKPEVSGGDYKTVLANDKEYASYVNDGHRMDRHFVPGLVINEESGMLEYNPDGKGGIMVGTKTKYVPGLNMVDRAKKVYEDTVREELSGLEDMLK